MPFYFLQVCFDKDASEERDEDRIAERYLPDWIADCLLQIVRRLIAGYLQVTYFIVVTG